MMNKLNTKEKERERYKNNTMYDIKSFFKNLTIIILMEKGKYEIRI